MARGIDKSRLDSYRKIITWLDGYVSLSCVDPSRIQKEVKKRSEDKDIGTAWSEVKEDVYDIARITAESEEILRLSKRLNIVRTIFTFTGVIVFLAYFLVTSAGVTRFLGAYSSWLFIIIFLVAFLAVFTLYITLNRRMNNFVFDYYRKHMGEVSKQRKHIKQVNQKLIDRLAMHVRANKLDPEKYKFTLLQKDYGNIKIVAEKQRRVMTYTVIVKGRSETSG